jgi:hypothetical protein
MNVDMYSGAANTEHPKFGYLQYRTFSVPVIKQIEHSNAGEIVGTALCSSITGLEK